jgi:hypothetical protein
MTDVEQIVVGAFVDFAQRPTGRRCVCELLRHQIVSYLWSVPVPLCSELPAVDPDCPYCRIVQWALCEVLDAQALDCLEAEVQADNPLAVAIWGAIANPGGIL